ncbi:prepilin peptidase [Patescibacteria group bacterium]|nr:MAG: prepilin peptidase [Patescibacteria group bacterium]
MLEVLLPLFVFGIGLCVGSFVNVQVFRFGFIEHSRPRSCCMACDMPISWYDLIPIFSYVALSGRCRTCGSALSIQYPLIEGIVGLLFLVAFFIMPPVLSLWSILAFAMLLVFLASLVALVAYDTRHTLVPMPFVYMLAGSALVASIAQSLFSNSFFPLVDSLIGGAVLFGGFFSIVLVTRGRGMGVGDAYVVGAAGLLLGLFRGIESVMFGVWSATIVYLIIFLLSSIHSKKRLLPHGARVTMKTELPFVPFLAFGIGLALFTTLSPLSLGSWLANLLWFQ